MLNLMHQLAVRLAPARMILIALAGSGAVVAGSALFAFEAAKGDIVLLPALVVLLWAVLAVVFIDVFASVPSPPDEGLRPWRRLMRKLSRTLYWVLALGFMIMGFVAADVSMYIAREWLGDRPTIWQADN
jgi:hypothetical protein